jgi:hypothetical protein
MVDFALPLVLLPFAARAPVHAYRPVEERNGLWVPASGERNLFFAV